MILKTKSLTPNVLHITQNKGTELPFSGRYTDTNQAGTFLCRQCGLALFRSQSKFHSGCGWPSFDEEISGNIKIQRDKDGIREEIICSRCQAHLGHVFQGEGFTPKNTRHCVNSLSLDFAPSLTVMDTEEALLAGGCFWGVEYYFKQLPGVLITEVGYMGGDKANPSYQDVCSNTTGHIEAIRVVYDCNQINFEQIVRFFMEIHDPTQSDGQGPDLGEQYMSKIFYYNDNQSGIAMHLIAVLENTGYKIVTQVLPATTFWPAEDYHQDYYSKTHKQPYCHRYVKRF